MSGCPPPTLLAQPLATAEFLALDTETNGLARERCELTEVGAVLVGGGELHDRWSSLVGVARAARPGHPALHRHHAGDGRRGAAAGGGAAATSPSCCRAACSSRTTRAFDTRVLKQAFARAALDWPDPPVLCTVALARRFAPLQRRRGLAVARRRARDRGGRDAPRAARRGDLRARAVRAAAAARRAAFTIGDALAAVRPKQGAGAAPARAAGQAPARRAARPLQAPERPGRLHLPRRRRAPAVRRQVGLPAHARPRALHDAGGLDRAGRARRLPADGVRARRAAAREPADQGLQAARQRELKKRRRRLRLPALPARHPVPDPRGRARAGRRPRRLRRPGARPRRRGRAGRADQLAVRPAPLRARDAAAAVAVRLRADGPLPVAVPRRPGPEPLPRAARGGAAAVRARRGGSALLAHVERQIRAASAEQAYERAAWLQRRRRRLESLLRRLGGALRAAHAGSRLVLAPHPSDPGARRRVLDRRRPRRRLGSPAGRRRSSTRARRWRCASAAPRAASAAGCRRRARRGADRRRVARRPRRGAGDRARRGGRA